MKFLKWLGIIVLLLIIVYFLGPKPSTPTLSNTLPAVPQSLTELETYIKQHESEHRLKPDNEARIVWANDSNKTKTEFAIVYLHGFSASQEEGDPVHTWFAKKFGCNLFLSRLAEHGVDTTEALANFTADKFWNSAKEAYAIAKQLGNHVILLATSTGGSAALKLAAEYPEIHSLILMSPNIAINDAKAWMLNNPWGLQIARMIKGPYNVAADTTKIYAQYWNNKYRLEGAVQLEELLETTMKESTFKKIRQPVLLLYYFKDEKNQDRVVKVSAMKRMFSQLGTADSMKRAVALPLTGNHVMGSYIKSKDIEGVERECLKFAKEVLHLRPLNIE